MGRQLVQLLQHAVPLHCGLHALPDLVCIVGFRDVAVLHPVLQHRLQSNVQLRVNVRSLRGLRGFGIGQALGEGVELNGTGVCDFCHETTAAISPCHKEDPMKRQAK